MNNLIESVTNYEYRGLNDHIYSIRCWRTEPDFYGEVTEDETRMQVLKLLKLNPALNKKKCALLLLSIKDMNAVEVTNGNGNGIKLTKSISPTP